MKSTVIGIKIKEQRKRLGHTQAAMAKRLNISPAYLNLIESNKRSVGGDLLKRIAAILNMDVQMLSGATEQRLSDDLQALCASQLFDDIEPGPDFANEIVARNPEWGRMMLTLYRAYLDRSRALSVMSDRLNRDTKLQSSVHRMLTHITSIRSVSEILNDIGDIKNEQRVRFHEMLQAESIELTNAAQRLVSYFDTQNSTNPTAAVAEKVDEFIISRQNYFPKLEDASQALIKEIKQTNGVSFDQALHNFLTKKLHIEIKDEPISGESDIRYKNQSRLSSDGSTLYFLKNTPTTTRRFQMLRVAAEIICKETLDEVAADPRLNSLTARHQARRALASYIASAGLMPYEAFLKAAETERYDINVLKEQFNVGYEQVCHRLVTLRRPGAEGVPFAFMRTDPSGYVSKRFPLPRFPLPRYGHACPLWPIFQTGQNPGQIGRHLSEFSNGDRFLMVSRSVQKNSMSFHETPTVFAVMLVCDIIHADRVTYSEGLDTNSRTTFLKIGPSCNQCSRAGCQQRQEIPWTLINKESLE